MKIIHLQRITRSLILVFSIFAIMHRSYTGIAILYTALIIVTSTIYASEYASVSLTLDGGQFSYPTRCHLQPKLCNYYLQWHFNVTNRVVTFNLTVPHVVGMFSGVGFSTDKALQETSGMFLVASDNSSDTLIETDSFFSLSNIYSDKRIIVKSTKQVLGEDTFVSWIFSRHPSSPRSILSTFDAEPCYYLIFPVHPQSIISPKLPNPLVKISLEFPILVSEDAICLGKNLGVESVDTTEKFACRYGNRLELCRSSSTMTIDGPEPLVVAPPYDIKIPSEQKQFNVAIIVILVTNTMILLVILISLLSHSSQPGMSRQTVSYPSNDSNFNPAKNLIAIQDPPRRSSPRGRQTIVVKRAGPSGFQ